MEEKEQEKEVEQGREGAEAETKQEEEDVVVAEVAPEDGDSVGDGDEGMVKKLSQALKENEDERARIDLMAFVTGKIFEKAWFRRQVPYIVMLVVLMLVYITNRYSAQQDVMRLDKLRQELTVSRNYSTACSAELVERLRESKVLEYLQQTPDSMLEHSMEVPVVVDLGE